MNPKIKVDDFVKVKDEFFVERDSTLKYPELSGKNYINSGRIFDIHNIIEKNGDKFYLIQYILLG